jgi:hypothetical protein
VWQQGLQNSSGKIDLKTAENQIQAAFLRTGRKNRASIFCKKTKALRQAGLLF